ncbi:MAG: hypothetical protein CMM02_15645 [Rhodopirellula sp.]|nr:hypothetical protein [Rhodopirellula sp.]
MNFTYQALTWGFLLALLPLLIHLINMMRHKRVEWAAMEFLLASYKKHRRWVWLKQLLLLLLRVFIIGLIVAMLAQWDPGKSWLTRFGGKETHHFILLDDSFSMGELANGNTAFDRALSIVGRIGTQASERSNQRFTLLRFSKAGELTVSEAENNSDADIAAIADFSGAFVDSDFPGRLSERQKDIVMTQTDAGPLKALQLLQTLVAKSSNQHRNIYLVSDFRVQDWENPAEVKETLAGLSAESEEIHLVDCVESGNTNLAITELVPADDTRAAGVPLFMHLRVKNYGTEPATNVQVKMRSIFHAKGTVQAAESGEVTGQIEELPIVVFENIEPGMTASKRVQVFFPEAGQHVVDAELPEDSILTDNSRYTVLDFPEGDNVLLIDGTSDLRNQYFITSVFRPSQLTNTGIIPDVQPVEFLRDTPAEALSKYSAIYLMDVSRLDGDAIVNLEQYVSRGGGLAWFAGEQIDINFFNENLYRNGEGLMPVEFAGPAILVPPLDEATPHLEIIDHPVFDFFLNERNPLIRRVQIDQYLQVSPQWEPAEDSTARIICKLHNQQPFAVEQQFGNGRVACFTTTLNPEWNNWGQDPSFVVVILKLHAHLTSNQRILDRWPVGTELKVALDLQRYTQDVTIITPGGEATTRPIETIQAVTTDPQSPVMNAVFGGTKPSATTTGTSTSGIYDIITQRNDGSFEDSRYALNVNASEGDTARIDREQLVSSLEPIAIQLSDLDAFQGSATSNIGGTASFWLMLILLLGLIGEQFFAYLLSYHTPKGGTAP